LWSGNFFQHIDIAHFFRLFNIFPLEKGFEKAPRSARSFLSRLRRFEYSAGRLVLEQ